MNALTWLEPLSTSVLEIDICGWERLRRLDEDLSALTGGAPSPLDQPARSRWLLGVRADLARRGHHAPPGPAGPLWQILAQFLAGYRDLDLRDSIGPGHGAMILTGGTPRTARHWQHRLHTGDLVGVAATERHGGSRIQEITTRARPHRAGRWYLSGEKCWVSRLAEASAFVVFFRDPDERVSAALIDATDPRLEREVIEPFGLRGWTWGILRLHAVPVDPANALIGQPGDGLAVFARHFARFRPQVTATALGSAAGIHTLTVQDLAARTASGALPRVRDHALTALGRTHAEITAHLLAALTATRLATAGHPNTDLTSRVGKAAGVDAAYRAVTDLAPLLGAAGYQQDHPAAKARADLTGLLYADGIHDSLYRSGGKHLLTAAGMARPVRRVLDPAA